MLDWIYLHITAQSPQSLPSNSFSHLFASTLSTSPQLNSTASTSCLSSNFFPSIVIHVAIFSPVSFISSYSQNGYNSPSNPWDNNLPFHNPHIVRSLSYSCNLYHNIYNSYNSLLLVLVILIVL